jgi:hypothetical protein
VRSLLLAQSFDLRPSNQCILVRVIPSCFHFAKMCLCQVSLLSRHSPRYGLGAHFHLCNECDVDRLGSVSCNSPFLNQFWIASRLVYSLCEAMAGSLSMATTAVSSVKVTAADSGEDAGV